MKGKVFTFLTCIALFLPMAGCANSIVPEATNAKYKIEIYTDGPPSIQLQEQINQVVNGKYSDLSWIANKPKSITHDVITSTYRDRNLISYPVIKYLL